MILKHISTISTGKIRIGGIFFLLGCLVFNGCTEKHEHDDPVLVRVGDYSITREKFIRSLEKVNAGGEAMTKGEEVNTVLDDLINAGLLLSLARQHDLSNDEQYKQELKYYKGLLYGKYGKMARCGLTVSAEDVTDDPGEALITSTVIDYIYVPSAQKAAYKDMMDRLNTGASTADLMLSPKFNEWCGLRLRFYSDIRTSAALLPADVLQKMDHVKTGELKSYKTGYGTYIVKVKRRFPEYATPQTKMERMLQVKMAEAVEKGDTLMDPFDLNYVAEFNSDLFDEFDFSVLPITDEPSAENGDPVVVEFFGKKMRKSQLGNEIGVLPLSIQALFRNKSTRIRAVTNYILHTNAGLQDATEQERMADMGRIGQFIRLRLKKDNVKDTVAYLLSLLQQGGSKGDAVSVQKILADATGGSRTGASDGLGDNRPTIKRGEKIGDYSWIFDDHRAGRENLRLNFQVIDKMSFGNAAGAADGDVVATGGNWKLRVGDLKNELDKLSTESRLELCKKDYRVKVIYYLSHYQGGPNDAAAVKVNFAMVDKIDLVGNDLDSLSAFKADAPITTLGHTVLTAARIRDIIATLPENERSSFLKESPTRYEALAEIMRYQYWQDQVSPQQLAGNAALKVELQNYERWLLARAYYNSVIYVRPVELNDESLDPYMKKACKLLSQMRLREALARAARESCITVNVDGLRELGGNISASAYGGIINKNCH